MATPLRVVRPTALTAVQIIYCNVPEDDEPAFASETTYSAGDLVLHQHVVYESAQDNNKGHEPKSSPTFWTRMGPSNRWRPFDRSYDSQAAQPGSIIYEIKPDEVCTAFAALNVQNATALVVKMVHPDFGEVYRREFDMTLIPLEPLWWGWWFSERRAPSQSLATDLPSFPGATVRIEFTGGDSLGVGVILLGQMSEFGLGVKTGARVGIDDYSRKEFSGFGDLELVERAWNKRASFDMPLEWKDVDRLQEFLASNRATPCLWIGSGRYEATTVYGTYGNFDIVISYYAYADCSIELKGLT